MGKASWVWPEQREPRGEAGALQALGEEGGGSLGLILRVAGSSRAGSCSMTRFMGWEDPLVAVGMAGLQQ